MFEEKRRMAMDKLNERFGEGFSERTRVDGTQDPSDSGRRTGRELLAELRGREKGVSLNDLKEKYQGLVDSGELKVNNVGQGVLERNGVVFKQPNDVKPIEEIKEIDSDPSPSLSEVDAPISIGTYAPIQESSPVQTITTNPVPKFKNDSGDNGYDFSQTLNANQDNDIYNSIVGSNNNVSSFQNNAIGNYSTAGGGLFAQRDPMGFKNKFMNQLFS